MNFPGARTSPRYRKAPAVLRRLCRSVAGAGPRVQGMPGEPDPPRTPAALDPESAFPRASDNGFGISPRYCAAGSGCGEKGRLREQTSTPRWLLGSGEQPPEQNTPPLLRTSERRPHRVSSGLLTYFPAKAIGNSQKIKR